MTPVHKMTVCSFCPSTPTHWSLSPDNQIIYACPAHQVELVRTSSPVAGVFPVGSIRERAMLLGMHPEIRLSKV